MVTPQAGFHQSANMEKWVLCKVYWPVEMFEENPSDKNVESFGWTSEPPSVAANCMNCMPSFATHHFILQCDFPLKSGPDGHQTYQSSMISMIRLQSAPRTYALDAMCFCCLSLYLRLEQQCAMEIHFPNWRKDCKHAWLARAGMAPLELLPTPSIRVGPQVM